MNERTKAIISAAVVLMVTLGAMYGVNLDGDAITDAILALIEAAAVIYACWKNHNFTEEAAEAQLYLDELKSGASDDVEDEEGE